MTGNAVELAAEMMAGSLYLPDGTPVDGPVTTAAEYANWLSDFEDTRWPLKARTADYRSAVVMWRNRAAIEGELYSLAIRGAGEMRRRGVSAYYNANFHPRPSVLTNVPDPAVHPGERESGIPSRAPGTIR